MNFARTGNPNGNGFENWPQYTASGDCYLEINATPIGSNCGIRKEKLDLWEEIAGFSGCVSTGYQAFNIEDDIRLFPNPAQNIVHYQHTVNENTQISLINSTGQKSDVQIENESIDISKLRPGLYFVQFQTERGVINKKLIVQN